MIEPIFAIILSLNYIIKVAGIQEMMSTSFQGSNFSDADNWVVSGAVTSITD
ncbi:unnamed protein product [Paramecium octaurelia]|uniref:Uncharacterized protein n=1 Tax=Paramecium octaurelia TaxID=43137 RepID=A0A8S1V2A1_PAROT|nr:unnamed protein product [Paramecium octaurelia]